MKTFVSVMVAVAFLVIFAGCSGTSVPETTTYAPVTTTIPPKQPSFSISEFTVPKDPVPSTQVFQITAKVQNTSEVAGTYKATLKINSIE